MKFGELENVLRSNEKIQVDISTWYWKTIYDNHSTGLTIIYCVHICMPAYLIRETMLILNYILCPVTGENHIGSVFIEKSGQV